MSTRFETMTLGAMYAPRYIHRHFEGLQWLAPDRHIFPAPVFSVSSERHLECHSIMLEDVPQANERTPVLSSRDIPEVTHGELASRHVTVTPIMVVSTSVERQIADLTQRQAGLVQLGVFNESSQVRREYRWFVATGQERSRESHEMIDLLLHFLRDCLVSVTNGRTTVRTNPLHHTRRTRR